MLRVLIMLCCLCFAVNLRAENYVCAVLCCLCRSDGYPIPIKNLIGMDTSRIFYSWVWVWI
jgi:hypothetical protein